MSRFRRMIVVGLAVALAVAGSGCRRAEEAPKLEPKIAPPAVSAAGVLKVGIDTEQPPFAGLDDSRTAGIDVDVASAVAEKLGLTVEWVKVTPSEAATALAEGSADIVMSVPYDDTMVTQVTMAGSYLTDAAAVFRNTDSTGSVEPSLTIESLSDAPIAVQKESMAYWLLLHELGEEQLQATESLRDALAAADAKRAPLAAGDAIVGAYIARDYPSVHVVGLIGDPVTLGIAVRNENAELEQAVSQALDELAAGGVLDTIRMKWVGELPAIQAAESTTSTDSATTK